MLLQAVRQSLRQVSKGPLSTGALHVYPRAQEPVLTGMVQVDCGMASQAAAKLDILGRLLGNYLHW